MAIYTVIWCKLGGDYLFTEVDTIDNPDDLSHLNWAQTAASIEYAHYPAEELQGILDDLEFIGYDLLEVAKGKLESVLWPSLKNPAKSNT